MFLRIGLAALCCVLALRAHASDLNGVWATNVEQCQKIFQKSNGGVSFAKDSDFYGNGFIIQGNSIKAKTATCSVKSRKEEGAVTHMVAVCATEVTLLDTRFSMRLIAADTLERIYPGMPELNSRYGRCEI